MRERPGEEGRPQITGKVKKQKRGRCREEQSVPQPGDTVPQQRQERAGCCNATGEENRTGTHRRLTAWQGRRGSRKTKSALTPTDQCSRKRKQSRTLPELNHENLLLHQPGSQHITELQQLLGRAFGGRRSELPAYLLPGTWQTWTKASVTWGSSQHSLSAQMDRKVGPPHCLPSCTRAHPAGHQVCPVLPTRTLGCERMHSLWERVTSYGSAHFKERGPLWP